jgi:hypothetical protein
MSNKQSSFSKNNVKEFRQDLESTLNGLKDKYGVEIKVGTITYDTTSLDTRLTIRVQGTESREARNYPGHQISGPPQPAASFCRHLIKWFQNDWWIAENFGFPYPEGWAVFNPKKGTILDTGLGKTQARLICRELNGRKNVSCKKICTK